MKVLCPIDFSNLSVNASKWAVQYLEAQKGGEIQFLHCINMRSRSSMFLKIDDFLQERAEQDMKELVTQMTQLAPSLVFDSKIFVVDPKSFIAVYADREGFDMIVTGTQGLTALKDITVGSVTEYLINKSDLPVLAIPDEAKYSAIKKVLLGIDGEMDLADQVTDFIIDFCLRNDASLHVIHFRQDDEDPAVPVPAYFQKFSNLDLHYDEPMVEGSIPESLNEYCNSSQSDLLCLVHRKRTWWQRMFSKSISKTKLFTLERPLLILPNSGKSSD